MRHGGLMGFDYQGAYAELVAIPQVALKNLFRIPDGLSDVHATFADPLSDAICGHKDIAVGARRHRRGDRRRARRHRARRDRAARGRRPGAPDRDGRRTGSSSPGRSSATSAWPTSTPPTPTASRPCARATEDIGADVVIVACSSDMAQEQAMEMAAPRGRVLFFGGLPKGTTHISFPSNVLHYRRCRCTAPTPPATATRCTRSTCSPTTSAACAAWSRTSSTSTDAPAAFGRIRAGEVLKVVVDAVAPGRDHPRPPLAAPLHRRRPARPGGRGRVLARRPPPRRAGAGPQPGRVAQLAARRHRPARGGRAGAAAARLGHLRHRPAAAAQRPQPQLRRLVDDRGDGPRARHGRRDLRARAGRRRRRGRRSASSPGRP